MRKKLGKIFAKASQPRHKSRRTFPVPADYIERTFRIHENCYREEPLAGELLKDVLEDIPLKRKLKKQSWVFQPELDDFEVASNPPSDNDPLNIAGAGAIICMTYEDLWGRDGMALVIIVPNSFNKKDVKANAVFAINGYLEKEAGLFHIHDLKYPHFDWTTNWLDYLSNEFFMNDNDVIKTFMFAERVTEKMFAGDGGKLYHGLSTLWDKCRKAHFKSLVYPWSKKPKYSDFKGPDSKP